MLRRLFFLKSKGFRRGVDSHAELSHFLFNDSDQLFIDGRKELIERLNHGHLASKFRINDPDLKTDKAAAHDDELFRNFLQSKRAR